MLKNGNTTSRRRSLFGLGAAAALGHSTASLSWAQTAAAAVKDSGVKMEKDVLIGKAGHTELHCDIYHPAAGSEKRIAVVHFHGGAFVAGSKNGSGIFSLVSHRRSSPHKSVFSGVHRRPKSCLPP